MRPPQIIDPDNYDRIIKLEVDDGKAATFAEAEAIVRGYRLQIALGADAASSAAWQAATLTAVNAGRRAMLGGVTVKIDDDPIVTCGWANGMRLSDAVRRFGGSVVTSLSSDAPTLVFGSATPATDGRCIAAYAGRWWAAVGPIDCSVSTQQTPSTIAAVLAAALGVSECFQYARGYTVAADRSVGISLWDPEADWRHPDAEGPAISELPGSAYILGLGHLGQAYLWLLGLLPYSERRPHLILQDDDTLSRANHATSMLAIEQAVGIRKTRLAAAALEGEGFTTALVERRYHGGVLRGGADPLLMLVGVDNREARATLDDTGFPWIVDTGLGAGPSGYLDMAIRRLPARKPARELWPTRTHEMARPTLQPAYEALANRTGDACGMLQLAERTVATAFVGTVAACFAIGGVLRELHGGRLIELVDLTLRQPSEREVAPAIADVRRGRMAVLPATDQAA